MAQKAPTKKRSRAGRPPVEHSPQVLELLERYEGAGTVSELMKYLGIGNHIFYKWLKEWPEFSEMVTRIKDKADDQVEAAFFKRCLGYDATVNEEKVTREGDVVDTRKEIHVPADPGAAFNWLKNRRATWQDVKTVEIVGAHAEFLKQLRDGEDIDGDAHDN